MLQTTAEWRAQSLVFYAELLVSVALENRDRLLLFWLPVQ
jgi:hypothetical protein